MTAASTKSIAPEGYPTIPDRTPDPLLVSDFIIKTVLPTEEVRIGYAIAPKIVYHIWERFGDLARPLIPTILSDFMKAGLIVESPFPRCWKRTPSSLASKPSKGTPE